jgi:replicative DNA helicase
MAANQMPHNLDAEAALLGCILIDESIQSELLETLKEDEFYQESHRIVLGAMREVYGARKPVDLVTLTDRLVRDGTLERAGGLRGVSELAELTPSAANYKQYFEIVRRDSVNRSLIRAAKDIIENSMKSKEEREAISYAEKLVYDISKQEDSSALTGLEDGTVIQEVLQKFETIQSDPNSCRGLETGFKHFDRITNGLQKSDLIVVAARPGVGKTSFSMNIVEHACLVKGKTAAVFSLEMPRVQLVQRLLCSYARVSMENALSGKLGQKDWKNLMLASDKLQKSTIFIDDSSRVTPAEILSKCRRLAAQAGGLDLVMIDYIQLMSGGGKFNNSENRQQEISSITRDLKIMAKELNVPVIALSQLRRIQTKEPQLSDLRESGAIEQDADIVMFISRPEVTASAEELAKGGVVKGAAEIIIAKHRNGSPGRVQLRFLGECTKFVDVEDQGQPDEEPQYHRAVQNWDNPGAEDVFPEPEDTGIPEE